MDINEFKKNFTYDPETGLMYWAVAGHGRMLDRPIGSPQSDGYLQVQLNRKRYLVHRVAWAITYGEWPDQVDHINGDVGDNRLVNLRCVSHLENHRNRKRPSNNTSGVLGVCWHKRQRRWQAQIMNSGKQVFLGLFATIGDAVAARKAAEAKYGFHENHGREA